MQVLGHKKAKGFTAVLLALTAFLVGGLCIVFSSFDYSFNTTPFLIAGIVFVVSGVGLVYLAVCQIFRPRDVILVDEGKIIVKGAFGRSYSIPVAEVGGVTVKHDLISRGQYSITTVEVSWGRVIISTKSGATHTIGGIQDINVVAGELKKVCALPTA